MNDKRSSLSRCIDSYNYEKFYYIDISGLYYKLITIVIDAARSDAPNWSVTLTIIIDDAS